MQNRLVIIETVLNTSFVMNNKQKLMIKKHINTQPLASISASTKRSL